MCAVCGTDCGPSFKCPQNVLNGIDAAHKAAANAEWDMDAPPPTGEHIRLYMGLSAISYWDDREGLDY